MISEQTVYIVVILSLVVTEIVLILRMNRLIKALKEAKDPLLNIQHFFNMVELHLKKFRELAGNEVKIEGKNEKLGHFEFKIKSQEEK